MNVIANRKGFSLIELVVGIAVFSAVMVIVITLVVNQTQQSIAPVLQTRAAELAQSLAAEIAEKAFDENSDFAGGFTRCGESGISCTLAAALGPEEGRALYDDVDDYNGLDTQGAAITDALGMAITSNWVNLYEGFRIQVRVDYDSNFDGVAETVGVFKLISIVVTTPEGDRLPFSFYRANY